MTGSENLSNRGNECHIHSLIHNLRAMAVSQISDEVQLRVQEWMQATSYSAVSLTSLTGGQTNFTYLARLRQAFDDKDGNRAMEVMVKHGEPYMARHPVNSITIERCVRRSLLSSILANT